MTNREVRTRRRTRLMRIMGIACTFAMSTYIVYYWRRLGLGPPSGLMLGLSTVGFFAILGCFFRPAAARLWFGFAFLVIMSHVIAVLLPPYEGWAVTLTLALSNGAEALAALTGWSLATEEAHDREA